MSIRYLWVNRKKAASFSNQWWKLWAKRALNLPGLLALLARLQRLSIAGCKIGKLTTVSASEISGNKSLLTIGSGTAIGRVHIALHAPVMIGDHVVLNDGAIILTATHFTDDPNWSTRTAPVIIEDYAWVAMGAMILPGVRIGRGAVVGARAVVAKDLPPYCIAVGNPAQIMTKRRPTELRYLPTASVAAYEAWLGRSTENFPQSGNDEQQ